MEYEKKHEEGLDKDGNLKVTEKDIIVMNVHILHNYNDKYHYENVECMIHLIRQKYQEANHE